MRNKSQSNNNVRLESQIATTNNGQFQEYYHQIKNDNNPIDKTERRWRDNYLRSSSVRCASSTCSRQSGCAPKGTARATPVPPNTQRATSADTRS